MTSHGGSPTLAERRRPPRGGLASVVLVGGAVTWAICVGNTHRGHVGTMPDDGQYLVSARALLEGRGLCLPSRPGNPPPKYPIGLPGLIALALGVVPGSP